jgi:hypothetical protein
MISGKFLGHPQADGPGHWQHDPRGKAGESWKNHLRMKNYQLIEKLLRGFGGGLRCID